MLHLNLYLLAISALHGDVTGEIVIEIQVACQLLPFLPALHFMVMSLMS